VKRLWQDLTRKDRIRTRGPVLAAIVAAAALVLGGAALLLSSSGGGKAPPLAAPTTTTGSSGSSGGPSSPSSPPTGSGRGAGTTVAGGGSKLRTDTKPVPLTACVASPHTCGYPDATTTGVPAGTSLTAGGSMTVTTAGAVIDGMDISGSISVRADNVTIQNSRIICGDGCSGRFTINVPSGVTGLTVRDVEAGGVSSVGAVIGGGGPVTVLRANLHGGVDGVHVVSGSEVRDSYIHDQSPTDTSHDDAIQQIPSQADHVTIVHNTLIPYNLGMHVFNNSAYICGSQCTATTNMTFTDNLLDGGSHTLQCPDRGTAGNVFARNRFGHNFRFGAITKACTATGNQFDASSNVFDDTRKPVISAPKG